MKVATGFVLFFALFVVQTTEAQKIKFQRLSVDDGMSQNTVNTIFQDSRGFMWFGTQNGLNKYDGNSFTIYKNVVDDSLSISSSEIYSSFVDKKQTIWFGTNAGLSRYNPKSNNFSNFDLFLDGQYAMRPVWCIINSKKDDNLWIGASGGLFSFDPTTKQFGHYAINDSIQNANSVRTLCEDRKGNLWVGTYYGNLYQFNKSKGTFVLINTGINSPNAGTDGVTCIMEDSEGLIWIGREDGVLSQYDFTSNTFIHFNDLKRKYPINTLLETKEGQLWVGTDKGGIYLFDKKNKKLLPLNDKSGNGTDVVMSLFNDKKGDVWIGTFHGGAFLFDQMDTTFNNFLPYKEIKNAEENNSVLAIYEDENDLWIGTDGGGLIQQSDSRTRYHKKIDIKNSIAGNTILCLTPADKDHLYIGTYANGMSLLDKRTGKFITYNQSNGLSDNSVWVIYPDNDFLWIGTNKGGVTLFDTKKGTFKYFTNTLKDDHTLTSNSVRSIHKDSRGKLWIGTVSGLNVFNPVDSTFSNYLHREEKSMMSNINVLCIYEDSKKNIWMGTHGGGINKYDYHTDTFVYYQEKDGLAGNIVYGILEDAQGNLWLSTNRGISKFDPEKQDFKNFDTRSGLANAQFNVGACHKNGSGKMYFGSVEGVCSFFPYNIRQNNFIPPVVITDFLLFNKPVGIGEDLPLKEAVTETDEVVLDYKQTVFSFKFSALNYTHSDKNSFAYKLEPFDKEWNYVDNVHTATYTNLDPGTYFFKVKGSNNDNVWNENATSVKVIIKPPYWQTIWFKMFLTVFVITIIYGAYKIKVSTIKKQKEILSHLVTQRTAEIEEKNKLLLETEMKNAQLVHQKLNDELALKSRELTSYTLLIIQKNKLLDELKKKLKEALRNPGSSNLRDFKNLLKLINYNFSPDKEWGEFNVNFNRIHEGFADALKARFSELTNNDLRLCALYRIGIQTKDIAEAMGISQTSVKMARYRLRKKLGLAPEEDISEFLQRIR
jgi:ligand-binding sensor domain-containing protein